MVYDDTIRRDRNNGDGVMERSMGAYMFDASRDRETGSLIGPNSSFPRGITYTWRALPVSTVAPCIAAQSSFKPAKTLIWFDRSTIKSRL